MGESVPAAFCGFDATYRELRKLSGEGATRWRVAMLASEEALSDGYFEAHEKWEERAIRIERQIRAGTY